MEQQQQMDFDPDVIMKEIIQRDMQNQVKEQQLAIKEQVLNQMAQQMQAEEMAQAQAEQAQAQEGAVIPVAPTNDAVIPPVQGGQPKQQSSGEVSDEIAQNLQPGQAVTITKKMTMTESGPMVVSKSENIAQGKQIGI